MSKSLKLMLYAHNFLPSVGGVQTIVLQLARGIAGRTASPGKSCRFEVTLVTETPGPEENDRSLPFRVVRKPGFWKLAGLVRKSDVVHLAGPALLPLSMGLLFGKPVVVEHHGFHSICPNGQLLYEPDESPCPGHFMAGRYAKCVQCNAKILGSSGSLRMFLLTPIRRWLSNRASKNITPTEWLEDLLHLRRSRTIVHGISTGSGSPSAEASVSAFAYQGRLVSTKGVGVLLEAFRRLCHERDGLCLTIIGSGPAEASLKAAAANVNGRVEFLDYVPENELDRALANAATVVMPSLGGEVFGLVAAENMLRGKLLIVSDLGALREVVGDAGFIFPAGDASALADRMRRALDHPTDALAMGRAARARAMQAFNLESMIEAHASTYQEAFLRKGG